MTGWQRFKQTMANAFSTKGFFNFKNNSVRLFWGIVAVGVFLAWFWNYPGCN